MSGPCVVYKNEYDASSIMDHSPKYTQLSKICLLFLRLHHAMTLPYYPARTVQETRRVNAHPH